MDDESVGKPQPSPSLSAPDHDLEAAVLIWWRARVCALLHGSMQPQYMISYCMPIQRHDCQTLLQQLTALPAQDSLVHNGTAAVPSQCCMIDLAPIATHPTDWRLASPPTLNIALDGCIVPCGDGARVDYAHVVVLDDFIDEPIRKQLMDFLTAPGWQAPHPPPASWSRDTADYAAAARTWGVRDAVLEAFAAADSGPGALWAKVEVQSRLAALYPDMTISHMPSHLIQQPQQLLEEEEVEVAAAAEGGAAEQQGSRTSDTVEQTEDQQAAAGALQPGQHMQASTDAGHHQQQQQQRQQQQHNVHHPQQEQQQPLASSLTANCTPYLANAAVAGDAFAYHVDADPATFPAPSPWTAAWGTYTNREPGKPLLFSLLLYLDVEWRREWQAETLLLDSGSGTGVVVVPRPCRALLLDQDVVHRLVAPAPAAGRPRYSLVWKLAMVPKQVQQQQREPGISTSPTTTPTSHPTPTGTQTAAASRQPSPSLARPEWGPPTYFGTAAAVQRVAKAVAAGAGSSQRVPTSAATHAADKEGAAAAGGHKRQAPQAHVEPAGKQQRTGGVPP